MEENFKVDIVGVGAPKCGTTWIAQVLSEHPELDFAKIKEPFYFLDENSPVAGHIKGVRRTKSLDQYKKLFSNDGRQKCEYSTVYMFDKTSLHRIKAHNPNVKILVCLRNPVDFLYSAFWFEKNSNFGHKIPDSFAEYLAMEPWVEDSIVRYEWSFFSRYLETLFEIFDRSQVHIIFQEEMFTSRDRVLKGLFEFLGIDSSYLPASRDQKVNSTSEMRSSFVAKLANSIIVVSDTFGFSKPLHFLLQRNSLLTRTLLRVLKKDSSKPKLDSRHRAVYLERYLDEFKSVEKILDRSLKGIIYG